MRTRTTETGRARRASLAALTAVAALAAQGCALGRAVPPAEDVPPVRLLGWKSAHVTGERVDLAVEFTGAAPANVYVHINGVPVQGCLQLGPDGGGRREMRCTVQPLPPGDLRVLVTNAAALEERDLRQRGLGLFPPEAGAGPQDPPGQWWLPDGWAGSGSPAAGQALATWLHVGPPDLRAAVLLQPSDPPRANQLVGVAGGTDAAELRSRLVWDPAPGEAVRGYLAGQVDSAGLIAALTHGRTRTAPVRPGATLSRGPGLVGLHGPRAGDARVAPAQELGLLMLARGVPLLPVRATDAGPGAPWVRCLVTSRRLHPALAAGHLEVLHEGPDALVLLSVLKGGDKAQVDDLALIAVRRGPAEAPQPLRLPLPAALSRGAPLRDACDGSPLHTDERGLLLRLSERGIRLWTAELR